VQHLLDRERVGDGGRQRILAGDSVQQMRDLDDLEVVEADAVALGGREAAVESRPVMVFSSDPLSLAHPAN